MTLSRRWLEKLATPGAPARSALARCWRRLMLRDLGGRDNHAGLERLYALPDPWGMESARERARFAMTQALIAERCGPVARLLEVGCGEGHQSVHLAQCCDQLDGIDVSTIAIERARSRLPAGRFGVGHVGAMPWSAPPESYDLVVACEVLYYMRDVPVALSQMARLGHACLATFYAPTARLVAPHLAELPNVERGWMHAEGTTWLWAFWRPGP
jgi:SAM-dependent methyltransferase